MPPWLHNNFTTIVAIVVILAPTLGRILAVLAKEKKKRDEQIAREREEIDRLRRGQPSRSPSAMTQFEQSASRRPVRAVPTVASRPRAPGSPRPQPPMTRPSPPSGGRATTTVRLPGGIVLEIPGDASPPSPTRTPTRTRQKPGTNRGTSDRAPAPTPQPSRRPATPAVEPEESAAHRLVSEQIAATARAPQRTRPMLHGKFFEPGDWKRAIVMNEILSPPVSMG